jgi:hypothetical protein
MKGRTFSGSLALLAVVGAFLAADGSSQAEAATGAKPLAHCNWGDFGCTNPPPSSAVPAKAATRAATQPMPAGPQQKRLTGAPGRAKSGCDPDLSSGGECWTNCKTEDDITICDIISLDTFWPEAPGGGPVSNLRAYSGRTVSKTYLGNKRAIGRVVTR